MRCFYTEYVHFFLENMYTTQVEDENLFPRSVTNYGSMYRMKTKPSVNITQKITAIFINDNLKQRTTYIQNLRRLLYKGPTLPPRA